MSSWKLVISLIVIAVLAVVGAAKFNFIDCSGIPVLSSFCASPFIRVAVIGTPSEGLEGLLNSEDFRVAGISYMGNLQVSALTPGVLGSQFDELILTNEVKCTIPARTVIADYVKAGGKLIVMGDACTKLYSDDGSVGWGTSGVLDQVMPVKLAGTQNNLAISKAGIGNVLAIYSMDHMVFPTGQKNYELSVDYIAVAQSDKVNSTVLAHIQPETPLDYSLGDVAVAESWGLKGKVIYFAYDPIGQKATCDRTTGVCYNSDGRNLLLNTLLYLKG